MMVMALPFCGKSTLALVAAGAWVEEAAALVDSTALAGAAVSVGALDAGVAVGAEVAWEHPTTERTANTEVVKINTKKRFMVSSLFLYARNEIRHRFLLRAS